MPHPHIYLLVDEQDAPVVICSELPTNKGSSVTYSANQIAAEVIRYHRLSFTARLDIEHYYPKEATENGTSETPSRWWCSLATRQSRGHLTWGRRGSL